MKNRKYLSVSELYSRKFRTANLAPEWTEHLGTVELGATILIWGESRNGKTSYALQMAKAFAMGGHRTLYMPLEEGPSLSLVKAMKRVRIEEARKLIVASPDMILEDLDTALSERNAPEVVVIDSLQYSGLSYAQYKEMRATHKSTTFIITSHADGRDPRGTTAQAIKYDAGVKVFVADYIANAASRYGGGESWTIWPEKIAAMEL